MKDNELWMERLEKKAMPINVMFSKMNLNYPYTIISVYSVNEQEWKLTLWRTIDAFGVESPNLESTPK